MMRVLVIGGIHPGGYAGLARDVQVLTDERVEPAMVATALTVQTVSRVERVQAVEPDVLRASLEAAMAQGDVRAVKVGLLPDAAAIETVRRFLQTAHVPAVVDPLLVAGLGEALTPPGHADALGRLLTEADLVTPNVPELEALSGQAARSEIERVQAAHRLQGLHGAVAVLSTGGHATEPVDLLVADRVHRWPFRRRALPNPAAGRGKGCELATRVSALLAKGLGLEEAVPIALRRLHDRLDHEARWAATTHAQGRQLPHYELVLERLLGQLQPSCVPEVGMNMAYAPSGCRGPEAVLGLAGRITIAGDGFAVTGRPRPGGPHHTGRIAWTAHALVGHEVWVLNHRWSPRVARLERDHVAMDRRDEPPRESTMEWMTKSAVEKMGRLPAFISDSGKPGKEAMIRILASSPEELLRHHATLHAILGRGEPGAGAELPGLPGREKTGYQEIPNLGYATGNPRAASTRTWIR